MFDRDHVSDDVFGNAYEHLIRNFASKAGKSSGEFYTPAEVAYLMAEIVQPHSKGSAALCQSSILVAEIWVQLFWQAAAVVHKRN
jgi:type I restriction-modification system DNA methylase subunit